MKKYVAYDETTFEFKGLYNEDRKDLPPIRDEVDPDTVLTDKGQHTHYDPSIGFYTPAQAAAELQERNDRAWRDSLLTGTDKYLVSDFPITPTNLSEVITFRTELRDYPLTWVKPTIPSFI